ncbi:MAG: SNF2-related protein [Apilactobacillus sp.]|nr:SNF2-related protein [Apilactobacillus sp.]
MLRNKDFKIVYSTSDDNIQEEFYIKALEDAIEYKRVSGYFSSSALALFAKGLYGLYKNNGKYYLLISNTISDEDYLLMKKGYTDKEDFRRDIRNKLDDFDEMSLKQKNDFCNLAYLIEIGLVEVKIGFKTSGIFHAKYGIIRDKEDYLLFSGSLNETKAAFVNNYESITVNKSWNSEEDKKTIIESERRFDDLWNNKSDDDLITVKEFNEILKDELLSYSKGKFIKMDENYVNKDKLVLKYDDKLILKNFYEDLEFKYYDSDMRTIRDVYLKSREDWIFKDDLSTETIKFILNTLENYAQNEELNLQIDDSLNQYLKNHDELPIDRLRETGTLIKNQDDSIMKQFDKFKLVVSSEMKRQLRDKQMWASFYMKSMRRAGNFSVPGSGKTSMVYGTFAFLRAIYGVDKVVVVGPKSSFKAWKDEYYENFGDDAILSVYDVQSKNKLPLMSSKEYNLYLFNYESLASNKHLIFNKILDKNTLLIFDEGHKIKSVTSDRSQIAVEMSRFVKYCFVLTGTPIPNNYSDIWNFMHILYDRDYGRVFGLDLNSLKSTKNNDRYSDVINEKLFPFYWRTNKKQLGVPEANDDHVYKCTVSEEEQKIASYLWDRYSDQPIVLFIRLIQLSSNPQLLFEKISSQNDLMDEFDDTKSIKNNDSIDEADLLNLPNVENSSKFNKAMEVAEGLLHEGKKIVIWCINRSTMQKVCSRINNMGYLAKEISGSVDLSERESIIEEFKHQSLSVIVSNPQTMAESVSLHDVCHDAMYLEFSFNLTHMLQSRDRIHRLGLKDTDETNYYYFFSEGLPGMEGYIDDRIYDRLKDKESLMKKAVDGTRLSIDLDFNEKKEIAKILDDKI